MTPLERDLLSNARDRLQTWARDTIMRCEVMKLDGPASMSMIFCPILDLLVASAVEMELNGEQLQHTIRMMYDVEVKNKSRNVGKRP